MLAQLRTSQRAYCPGHRIRLTVTVVPEQAAEACLVAATLPGGARGFWAGGNVWQAAECARIVSAPEHWTLLDLPACGLPFGEYHVAIIADGRQAASHTFQIGEPAMVAQVLSDELSELYRGLGELPIGSFHLDDSNSIVGTSADVRWAIQQAWEFLGEDCKIEIEDRLYRLPHPATIRFAAALATAVPRQYVSEWFDCDDHSVSMTGWLGHPALSSGAWGRIWGKREKSGEHAHAMCLAVTSRSEAVLIEPQTGVVMAPGAQDRPDDRWRPWLIVI